MRPTICSLFEPHYKQNLYTNPKRTAKFAWHSTYLDSKAVLLVQNKFSSIPSALNSKNGHAETLSRGLLLYFFHGLNPPSSQTRIFFSRRLPGRYERRISVKILVLIRCAMTRPSGVRPSGASDSRRASSLPAPDASTQTWRAAFIAGYPSVIRRGGGLVANTGR